MAKSSNQSVKFTKQGVFIQTRNRKALRVGDPIRVFALGQGLQDRVAYTILELQDRDGKWRKPVVRSSLLSARTAELKERLADIYNYRLPRPTYCSRVIGQLAAKNPSQRVPITAVPGWQGNRYVHPHEIIKRKGDKWECVLADNYAVQLGEWCQEGTLAEWKRRVAQYCQLSSRLRLAVGAPFAATIIRRRNIDSFGLHFVGDTSSGKTLCLRIAGSVAGVNSNAGVTSWDGTPTGLEQLALARRDNVLTLDEVGLIEGNGKQVANFIQLTAFRLGSNQQKTRAGHYSRSHTVNADLRSIMLSTGEDLLPVGKRLRGRDVRLMQIPASISTNGDIFDADKAPEKIGKTANERERFVTRLEASTRQCQGTAQRAFLRRLVNDTGADRTLKAAAEKFISKAPLPQSDSGRAFARLRRRIAEIYAAMALAIDYRILPFNKNATLRDLRKCMNDGIDLLIKAQGQDPGLVRRSDSELINEFRNHVLGATFVRAGKYAKRQAPLTAAQIEAADGFVECIKSRKYRVVVQTGCVRRWHAGDGESNRLVALLRERKILREGRQADTSSRQVKLFPYPKKISVYWLSIKALGLTLEDLHVR